MNESFKEQYVRVKALSATFPQSSSLILHVYEDLVLNKLWKIVTAVPVQPLNTCILHAHEPDTPFTHRLVILPRHHDQVITMEELGTLFAQLSEQGLSNDTEYETLSKITFAIVASDSTILYYHIDKGLLPPKEH